MPFVEVKLAAGRTPGQIRALLTEVHGAVRTALAVPDERIRVVVTEVPPEHWMAGGTTLADRDR